MRYKEYRIGDVFITERCPNTKKELLVPGETPYVTRTCLNNGVQQYCGNTEGRTSGNCIIIGDERAVSLHGVEPQLVKVLVLESMEPAANQ